MSDILAKLTEILEQRKQAKPDSSYVARLYHEGTDAILKKIGEESTELIVAAKSGSTNEVTHETADLWFHTLILLASQGLTVDDVLRELERRFGVSGLDEKAHRGSPK